MAKAFQTSDRENASTSGIEDEGALELYTQMADMVQEMDNFEADKVMKKMRRKTKKRH